MMLPEDGLEASLSRNSEAVPLLFVLIKYILPLSLGEQSAPLGISVSALCKLAANEHHQHFPELVVWFGHQWIRLRVHVLKVDSSVRVLDCVCLDILRAQEFGQFFLLEVVG